MMQIIFLAVATGIGLLYLGRRTETVAKVVDQLNALVSLLMRVIGKLVPAAIFLVLVVMVWSRSLETLGNVWKFLAVYAGAVLVFTALMVLWTAWRRKVNPWLLIRKSSRVFMLALSTASETATFAASVDTCENRFGIDSSLVSFGLPLGTMMHCPVLTIYYLTVIFFFAGRYGVACSPIWLAVSVFVAIVMAVAAPPVPGGSAVVFAVLFAQMGIPLEAVTPALAIDALMDHFIVAFEQMLIPMSLINASAKLGMLKTEVLRAERK
jgi:Na+/H+-dicarboxylate symporter